jgi:hypothetical protein
MHGRPRIIVAAVLAALVGCAEVATLTVDQGSGPEPVLPPPKDTLIPTVNIAPAVRWQPGEAPGNVIWRVTPAR